jgi:hypothetical protein
MSISKAPFFPAALAFCGRIRSSNAVAAVVTLASSLREVSLGETGLDPVVRRLVGELRWRIASAAAKRATMMKSENMTWRLSEDGTLNRFGENLCSVGK